MLLAALAPLLAVLPSQAGDRPGEAQPPPAAEHATRPAPALDPAAARATFDVAAGLEVRLVAAEPLVRDPVAAAFDFAGRLWVVEMSGFMPNIDGAGEQEPVGAVVVLSDSDGDGCMDERSVFLDGLVLPRGVAPMLGGALVLAPPDLLFCRDTNGDGRADECTVVDTGLGGIESPEHAANGLVNDPHGWTLLANWSRRYRFRDGAWQVASTAGGGQWGITLDDTGRVYFNTNSDPLRCDPFPSHYAVRNPSLGLAPGVNVRVAHDMEVRPIRPTPGVNRGYQLGVLRDGRLTEFTAACGPLIYRGDALGEAFRGNAFVCEPAGNLVKRYVLTEDPDGTSRAMDPDRASGGEFLASTDERFRPVSLLSGPDGALYVVDMYRGVIQHRLFVTTFLREQVLDRGLEQPIGLGRIWRIAAKGQTRREPFPFENASWTEIVDALAHPDGWTRDMAHRLLIEEGCDDARALEKLHDLLGRGESVLTRVHAVQILCELRRLDEEETLAALHDPDPRVVRAAVRASEPQLAAGSKALAARVAELASSSDRRLRLQSLHSLGEARTSHADRALAEIVLDRPGDPVERGAVQSGLHGRELEVLELLLADPRTLHPSEELGEMLVALARCIVREARTERVRRLRELAVREESRSPVVARLFEEILQPIATTDAPSPLTPDQQQLFDWGRDVYVEACAQCHHVSGEGEPGKAPRLRGSPWVLGSQESLVRILLHGMTGPLEIDGVTWRMDMPSYAPTAEDVAAVLTYVRREWGNSADPIEPETVDRVRGEHRGRTQAWTVAELEAAERAK